MSKFTIADLQELLDQVPEGCEITGINYKPEGDDKYSCCIYVTDEVKSYRLKFYYFFKKSLPAIFIGSSK